MRGIRILWVSVSMLLMLSLLVVNEGASPSTTYMNVIPAMRRLSPGTLGTFKINITITDVVDLYAWQVNMTWNTAVLNLTSHAVGSLWVAHIYFGNFMALQPGGTTKQRFVDYAHGWATIGETSKGEIPGVDGSGNLVQVEFTVKSSYGSSKLDIASNYWLGGPPWATTFLYDRNLWEMPMTPKNGYFDNRLPGDVAGPGGPGVYDGFVNAYDLGYVVSVFGSSSAIADYTGPVGAPDGIESAYDLHGVGANFGEEYP